MAEILFYHLTESKLDDTLPKLLERSLERGMRAVVQTSSDERVEAIDALLWTFRDDSFLPHGSSKSDFAADQPVLLTTGTDNPNQATIRFLVDGAEPGGLDSYQRAVFLFDGFDNQQVVSARGHWKHLKGEGHDLSYWQQDSDGRWSKKS